MISEKLEDRVERQKYKGSGLLVMFMSRKYSVQLMAISTPVKSELFFSEWGFLLNLTWWN